MEKLWGPVNAGELPLHSVFHFGKYRGRQIDQVDVGYLQWIVDEFPKSHSWWKVAASALTRSQSTKRADVNDLLSDLKSCTRKKDLQKVRGIHTNAVEAGVASNICVAVALMNLYAKCGSMEYATRVFDNIQEPDVMAWTALILGYVDNGKGLLALNVFSRMKDEGKCEPNSFTYLATLKACTLLAGDGKRECLEKGRRIHLEIGCHMDHFVQSTLINLYAKCGSMKNARAVFDSIQKPNVVSWTALILGYADNRQGLVALELFSRMKSEGTCAADSLTYVAALKACTLLAANGGEAGKREGMERGKQVHSEIGRHMNRYVQNTLINLYAKCGNMEEARKVFNSIQEPNVVSCNALILGYAENGQGFVALDIFSWMQDKRMCPLNSLTFLAALKACTLLALDGGEAGQRECLERGRKIHLDIGCHMDECVQSTLIKLYSKCGSMEDARTVFDSIQRPNVVCWTALILGYADNGQGLIALDLFSRMKNEGRCVPNSFTYLAALQACTSLAADGEAGKGECLKRCRKIHSEIGGHMDYFIQNTLVNLFAKCGSMDEARTMFDSITEPNVVSWTAIIQGYAENGQGFVALDLFSRMKDERRCPPDSLTYVAALTACCSIGALAIGRRIHSMITDFDTEVVTCLVDFYAKCGSMEKAREVFDLHPRVRDVSTWTALLTGYAQFGDTGSVFNVFQAMQDQGFQPNSVTFVCMLSCCSHAGLVKKAWEYFEVMPTRYGVTPTLMHYNCMIDLLGRANKLDEAVALLQRIPCDPHAVTWMTLLGACRKWKNVDIGRWAFKSLLDLDQNNAPAYVLMAEIYGSRGMWEEQEKVLERRMRQTYVMDGMDGN